MKKIKSIPFEPYSLSIQGASEYFGVGRKILYSWITTGKLHQGRHYLKVGRKPLIIRQAFIEFLEEERHREKVFSVAQTAEMLGVDKEVVYGWLSIREPEKARIPEDGWFHIPTNHHIRIKEWAVEGLRTGEFHRPEPDVLEGEKETEEDEDSVTEFWKNRDRARLNHPAGSRHERLEPHRRPRIGHRFD